MKKLLLFLPLVLLFSCTEPQPPNRESEYALFNKSGVDLCLVLYQKTNDTIEIANDDFYSNKIYVDVIGPRPFNCDSIGIIFNFEKKVVYKWLNTSARNPLLVESYMRSKINEYHYLFQYTFIEQDFLNISNKVGQ